MSDVNRGKRPLSPFMIGPYYRPQMTSISSIFVRITGNALIVAAILVAWWLLAAATSEAAFNVADAVITSFLGDLVMFLSVWALWYHALGGLRHLLWDTTGKGMDVEFAEKMGWGMFGGSVVLAILTAIIV